ncbi:hypothetical protein [Rahnella variigena]|uniref:hypothetical protein n=1 Tax=Rahnella variigena TaxID=574964 RepID=UPI001330C993|nr:hypothetical protein [Rahnella variigena]
MTWVNYDYMRDRYEELDAAVERVEQAHKQRVMEIADTYSDSLSDFADKSKLSAEQISALNTEEAQDAYSKLVDVMATQIAQGRISKMENAA